MFRAFLYILTRVIRGRFQVKIMKDKPLQALLKSTRVVEEHNQARYRLEVATYGAVNQTKRKPKKPTITENKTLFSVWCDPIESLAWRGSWWLTLRVPSYFREPCGFHSWLGQSTEHWRWPHFLRGQEARRPPRDHVWEPWRPLEAPTLSGTTLRRVIFEQKVSLCS